MTTPKSWLMAHCNVRSWSPVSEYPRMPQGRLALEFAPSLDKEGQQRTAAGAGVARRPVASMSPTRSAATSPATTPAAPSDPAFPSSVEEGSLHSEEARNIALVPGRSVSKREEKIDPALLNVMGFRSEQEDAPR